MLIWFAVEMIGYGSTTGSVDIARNLRCLVSNRTTLADLVVQDAMAAG